jgi:hypothetical protein
MSTSAERRAEDCAPNQEKEPERLIQDPAFQFGTEIVGEKEIEDDGAKRRVVVKGFYGVVFHFHYWDDEGLDRSDRVIESVERDILAYAYREKRPFRSAPLAIDEDLNEVVVEFPDETFYVAEGEVRVLVDATERAAAEATSAPAATAPSDPIADASDPAKRSDAVGGRKRTFRLCAFRTVFSGEQRRGRSAFYDAVLHVGLVPLCDGDGNPLAESILDEYDVIRLVKLWEGGEGVSSYEPHAMQKQLGFRVRGSVELTSIGKLAIRILDGAGVRKRNEGEIASASENVQPLAGTVQLQVGTERWTPIYERLAKLRSKTEGADASFSLEAITDDFKRKHRSDLQPADVSDAIATEEADRLWSQLLALQGILCGLLNVDLADDAEMRDTFLLPMNLTADAMLAVNKGTMLMVSDDCRLGRDLAPTLGVNPFLTIPHAALLYNEIQLNAALENARTARAKGLEENHLQRAEVEMRRALQERYLPNIFHYSRERTLFDQGVESRRFRELEKDAFQRLDGVDATLDEVREGKQRLQQFFLDLFVAILTIVQVMGNYEQLHHLATDHLFAFCSIVGFTILLGAVVFVIAIKRGPTLRPGQRFGVIAVAGIVFWIFLYIWLRFWATDESDRMQPPNENSRTAIERQVDAAGAVRPAAKADSP